MLRKDGKSHQQRDTSDSEESGAISLDDDDDISSTFSTSTPDGGKPVEGQDAECMFCSSLFSEDKCGEKWVMCMMCDLWAHQECAGYDKGVYICDYCK